MSYAIEGSLNRFPDVELVIETDKDISAIKRCLAKVPDSHVMRETLQPYALYDGERRQYETGTNLMSLLDGLIAIAVRDKDLSEYKHRIALIHEIEDRLRPFDWISLSDGATFSKTFKPE